NMKQLGTGVLMYIQDYDETLPLACVVTDLGIYQDNYFTAAWQNVIQPYLKNQQIFRCPSDSTPLMDPARPTYRGTNGEYSVTSYLYNGALGNHQITIVGGATDDTSPRVLAEVNKPVRTILFAEGHEPLATPITAKFGVDFQGHQSLWATSQV